MPARTVPETWRGISRAVLPGFVEVEGSWTTSAGGTRRNRVTGDHHPDVRPGDAQRASRQRTEGVNTAAGFGGCTYDGDVIDLPTGIYYLSVAGVAEDNNSG